MANFFKALFDLTLTKYITRSWARMVFIFCLLQLSLIPLFGLWSLVHAPNLIGLFIFMGTGLVFIVLTAYCRMFLESVVVFFRMEEHLDLIASKMP